MTNQLNVGDQAPDFLTLESSGKEIKLSQFKGKFIVLYFYPKDDTPGCTIEAQEFTEALSQYSKAGAVVLGVSTDDSQCHQAFIKKYGLKITLLCDPDQKIATLYNSNGAGYASRNTFLIDPTGKIKKIYLKVSPRGHAEEVLKEILGA